MKSNNTVLVPYFPLFDWLRAVCACVVMLHHDGAFAWGQAGNFAVQVFFALSGWLIGGILLRLSPSDLPRFYFNRAVRIWAPYYFALFFLLAVSVLREPITAKWIEFVIYKILFVHNIFGAPQLAEFVSAMPQKGTLNHLWSVNAEEQFYLVAPIILVIASAWRGRSILMWLILALFAWYFDIYAAIVFGVLAAVIAGKCRVSSYYFVIRFTAFFLLGGSIFCLVEFSGVYREVAPIAAIAIVLILAKKGTQTKLGAITGGMSYPLYLNHWCGMFLFNFLLPNMRGEPIRIAAAAIVNIVFAILLYWYFDRQLLAQRSVWYSERRAVGITVIAYATVILGLLYGTFMMYRTQLVGA